MPYKYGRCLVNVLLVELPKAVDLKLICLHITWGSFFKNVDPDSQDLGSLLRSLFSNKFPADGSTGSWTMNSRAFLTVLIKEGVRLIITSLHGECCIM